MKTQILMVAIVAGIILQAVPAMAQDMRGDRPDFATLDTDGDGALTLEELQGAAAAQFAKVDTDGDGLLSADELTAARAEAAEARVARMVERLDTNEDGGISLAELQVVRRGGDQMSERMFGRIDADDNGTISAEEFEQAQERRGGGKRGGKNGGSRGDRG